MLLHYGLAPTHAQPLKKYAGRTGRVDQRERLHWVERIRAAAAASTRDDPAVLPPTVRGQLPLFPVRRMLSIEVCRRILQRPLAGYADAVEHTARSRPRPASAGSGTRVVHERTCLGQRRMRPRSVAVATAAVRESTSSLA